MQFVKRRGATKAKIMPSDFQSLQEQFLDYIRSVVMFEAIPAKLIINWDHTGFNYVPTSSWTLEAMGSQKVPTAAINDKRQLTVDLACTLARDFLPPQIIYNLEDPGMTSKYVIPTWMACHIH